MVVVYHSARLTVHHVGTLEQPDTSMDPGAYRASSGRMIIGRKSVDINAFYTSVIVDELTLWNRSLTTQENKSHVLDLLMFIVLNFIFVND